MVLGVHQYFLVLVQLVRNQNVGNVLFLKIFTYKIFDHLPLQCSSRYVINFAATVSRTQVRNNSVYHLNHQKLASLINILVGTRFSSDFIRFSHQNFWHESEAVIQRCSVKKVFLEISQNTQENTCARVFFNKVAGPGVFL